MLLSFTAILSLAAAAAPARADAGSAALTPLTIVTDTGAHVFHVEQAVTAAQREHGLMDRTVLAADRGMLFRFPRSQPVTMWMKNTRISLDMIFARDDGTITGIAADTVPLSETLIASPGRVRYVLELNGGTAARIGVAPGDRITGDAIVHAARK